MTKKITHKNASYILNSKKINTFKNKAFFKHKLTETVNANKFYLQTDYRLWVKILFTIQVCLIILIHSLWDGGLQEGLSDLNNLWQGKCITEEKNYYTNSRYARMKKVFDKR